MGILVLVGCPDLTGLASPAGSASS